MENSKAVIWIANVILEKKKKLGRGREYVVIGLIPKLLVKMEGIYAICYVVLVRFYGRNFNLHKSIMGRDFCVS